ncbi:unnamed protein product [Ceratitis capitata]|uniref:(Mediterranean fruit fly) hypothetical protein n=1 Tax=Ceratitis capitata TaxID=7213 RepID=A0A811U6G5_CERCA|nr:unnamed protein product [Ceratitis capitata]
MATNANDNNEKQFSKGEQEGQSNQADAKNPKTVTTTASTKITNVAKKHSSEKSMQSPCVQEDKSMAPELLTLQSGTPIAPKTPTTDDDIDREAENQKDPGRGGNIGLASPPDNQYFFEDEVFRIDKKGRIKFGLITETAETYSADEDEDFEEMVLKGEVRIAWYPEGKEEVHVESAIGLADRTLMPGDVVRRLVPGKDTQRGYCRNISCHADVKVLGTKYVIKNRCCLDSWVGSTKDVEEKAVLKSTAGTRIEITCQNFYGFTDYYSRDSQGKPLRGKYTIESVETDSVWVHWQCKALSEESSIDTCILEQPNPCVSGEDLKRLKRLNLFESCMLQISDRNYLKFSNLDSYIKKSQWEKEQASKFKVILEQIQKNEKQSGKNSSSGNESFTNLYNTNHAERARKKSSLIDVDAKMVKPKKSTLKTEKLSTASKEKSTNEASPENTASNVLPARKSSKSSGDTEWVTDDEDEDDDDDVYSNDDFFADRVSTTTCSSPSPHQSPKHSKRHLLKKKSKTTNKPSPLLLPEFQPKEGDELVTETLLVYSTATVVWQDGTVEAGIPATQLYPIHHLDNHEFFPGDFVVSGKEEGDITYRDYGVVQTVDHQGRIARVKWFTTYTSADEPKPTYNGETEVSVYDLKDHPDFQYRPGTMVIRVANFSGEDAVCTAGQVIDNYIDGRAKVWWVDGHISMCWPQDLFEVGQYDHADWGHESDDSWETESENSELGGSTPVIALEESHIITNIERTRVAIARLEEIFNISPNLQNADVMKNLLNVYKGCRYLDRLLNTSFFHEDNFQGLIERVRKGGTQSISERAQDRKNRLFSYVHAASPNTKQQQQQQQQQQLSQPISMRGQRQQHSHYYAVASLDSAQKTPKAATSSDGTNDSTKSKDATYSASGAAASVALPALKLKSATSISTVTLAPSAHNVAVKASVRQQRSQMKLQQQQLAKRIATRRAFLMSVIATSQDDSGNYSRNENCDGSSTSHASYSDLTTGDVNSSTKVIDDQKSVSCSSIEFNEDTAPEMDCVRLCAC